MSPIWVGMVLFRSLKAKSSKTILSILPNQVGIPPLRLVSLIEKSRSFVNLAYSCGMVPGKKGVSAMNKYSRLIISPRIWGMVPVYLVDVISRWDRAWRLLKSGGKTRPISFCWRARSLRFRFGGISGRAPLRSLL